MKVKDADKTGSRTLGRKIRLPKCICLRSAAFYLTEGVECTMKKICFLLLCSFCLPFAVPVAWGAPHTPPRRIAILPVVNQTNTHRPEIERYCNDALQEALRVPLNSILNVHEYISADAIDAALPELKEPKRRHILSPDRLKAATETLDADLVVGFVLGDWGEYRSYNWNGEEIQYTFVFMQLVGYDRQKDAFLKWKHRSYYHDTYSSSGTLEALLHETVDYLLQKADFKKDIFPLRPKYEAAPNAQAS